MYMSKELKCFLAVWTNMVEQVGHLSTENVVGETQKYQGDVWDK